MRKLTVDTTEAQSFEAVEPGPYPMTVHSISDPQKGPKSTYVEVQFQFDDPGIQKKAGRARRNYPITGAGAGFFREFWKATTGEDIPIGTTIDVDLDQALNKPVIAMIENKEYEGRLQNEVKQVTARA